MKESIYIETSVVSYYVSKPSRDLIVLAHQQITWEWWSTAVKRFDVYISEVVIEEAAAGNKVAAEKRLKEKLKIKTPVICTPEELMEV